MKWWSVCVGVVDCCLLFLLLFVLFHPDQSVRRAAAAAAATANRDPSEADLPLVHRGGRGKKKEKAWWRNVGQKLIMWSGKWGLYQDISQRLTQICLNTLASPLRRAHTMWPAGLLFVGVQSHLHPRQLHGLKKKKKKSPKSKTFVWLWSSDQWGVVFGEPWATTHFILTRCLV